MIDDCATWSWGGGATICLLTEDQHNECIDGTTRLEDIAPILELGLKDYTLIQPEGNR